MLITYGMTDKISLSESSRELENNYRTLPLTIIDRIVDELSSSKSFRECKNITRISIKNI
jgi:hypothetical protein